MKITCISVGKKHDPELADAIERYEIRLKQYCDFDWQLIPPSDVVAESAAILRTIKSDDVVLLLDERGLSVSNQKLAQYLAELQNRSVKRLVLIIGGAYGVGPEVRSRAQAVLSLSKLVFPHQLVRLIAVEQLYRSYSILAGSKYHHGNE